MGKHPKCRSDANQERTRLQGRTALSRFSRDYPTVRQLLAEILPRSPTCRHAWTYFDSSLVPARHSLRPSRFRKLATLSSTTRDGPSIAKRFVGCGRAIYMTPIWALETVLPPGSIAPNAKFAPAGSVHTVRTLSPMRAQQRIQSAATVVS